MEFPLLHRKEFATLIAEMDLRVGVEIGVARGNSSRMFLDGSPLETLYGVDIAWRNGIPQDVADSMQPYVDAGRFIFVPGSSLEAVSQFEDGSFDFVHIDANHHYPYVNEDIKAWWPKLRVGGLFAGHDYHYAVGGGGVVAAVDEFQERENQDVYVLGSTSLNKDVHHLIALLCGMPNRFGDRARAYKTLGSLVEGIPISPEELDKIGIYPSWWCVKK